MDFDPKKNYYQSLDIPENASADDIKKAFRKAAVKHHPDKGGDKAKFQEMNEAYQVLSDVGKRSQYDAYRKGGYSGGNGGFGGGADFGGFGGGGFDGVDLGDLFGSMFGGGFGGGGSKQDLGGEDIKVAINITFEESFLGATKKVAYTREVKVDGVESKTCSTCKGRGRVNRQMQTPFGVMQSQAACPDCGGVGKLFFKNGKQLDDGGLEKKKETIEVKIPSGINDGVYIKFTGKGNEGISEHTGDLYIQIRVQASTVYERKSDNLYVKVPVSLFNLVLGGEVTVSHPEGKLKVKIPKGTQIGDMIKVAGKGFGEGGIFGKKGDFFLIPKLEIPKKLSKEEEKLWSELSKLSK